MNADDVDAEARAFRLCEELLLHEQHGMLLIESARHHGREQSAWHELLDQVEEGHRQRAQQLHACILEWGGQPRSLLADENLPGEGDEPALEPGDLERLLQQLLGGYRRLAELKNWAGAAVRQLDEMLERLARFEVERP